MNQPRVFRKGWYKFCCLIFRHLSRSRVGISLPCTPQEKHFPTDLADLWQTDEASHLFSMTGIKLSPLSRAGSLLIGREGTREQGELYKCWGAGTPVSTQTSSEGLTSSCSSRRRRRRNFHTTRSYIQPWHRTQTSICRTA